MSISGAGSSKGPTNNPINTPSLDAAAALQGPGSAQIASAVGRPFSIGQTKAAAPINAAPAVPAGTTERIRERLGAGETPDQILHAEVGREIAALTGITPSSEMVGKLSEAVKSDPALWQIFEQLVAAASDKSPDSRPPVT